ncbi:heavy-metal-associated domain-containing protein [Xanthomarina sp. GH4-25]|uniref:heavy-metal-associated domain-containing protein n=1 Tax=Xanthomarina sp. GH4-25 TaxID=3349335 RepID=UPI003878206E
MKKIGVLLVMLISMSAFSQDKNARATIEVDGVCNMCKERIEKACIKTKGVKSAVWNVSTHELNLIYDARKTDLNTIENNIAAVGHDTENVIATDEAYNSVHNCCRYRDESVVDDHKDD